MTKLMNNHIIHTVLWRHNEPVGKTQCPSRTTASPASFRACNSKRVIGKTKFFRKIWDTLLQIFSREFFIALLRNLNGHSIKLSRNFSEIIVICILPFWKCWALLFYPGMIFFHKVINLSSQHKLRRSNLQKIDWNKSHWNGPSVRSEDFNSH